MSDESKKIQKTLESVFYELLSRKNFDLLDSLFAPNAVFYDGEKKYVGREAIKEVILDRSAAIPDIEYKLDDILIIEDRASLRWHAKGKVIRDVASFKAGGSANYWGISMFQLKNGLITINWSNSSIQDAPKL